MGAEALADVAMAGDRVFGAMSLLLITPVVVHTVIVLGGELARKQGHNS